MVERPVEVVAAARPHPHETVNGDAWSVIWQEQRCRIAVVDGLGHGPAATEAAQRALHTLAARPRIGLVEAVQECHQALRSTRGAALTLVDIDVAESRLSHSGVGNVEARIWRREREQRLSAARGIVGNVLPRLVVSDADLSDDWVVVIHTDGVSVRMTLDGVLSGQRAGLKDIAESLLQEWSRPTDDATIVMARPATALSGLKQ